MKSFTNLEQSKKLAEILPLESADMHYLWEGQRLGVRHSKELQEGFESRGIDYTPCWSLAALISVLPRFIEYKGNKYYLRFMKEYVEYANDEFSITGRWLHSTGNDNLVDACVEMIDRLHEQMIYNFNNS